MVLLIRKSWPGRTQTAHIYIPLWFYLYLGTLEAIEPITSFTFHYGSTYTGDAKVYDNAEVWFTFHYGSTYTATSQWICWTACLFTFHYGSTYTMNGINKAAEYIDLHSTMVLLIREDWLTGLLQMEFTFHYGSTYTQIGKRRTERWFIYIPLWFYLYELMVKNRKFYYYLHSTMVLLIPALRRSAHSLTAYLHSTMVLLIPVLFHGLYLQHFFLINCRPLSVKHNSF